MASTSLHWRPRRRPGIIRIDLTSLAWTQRTAVEESFARRVRAEDGSFGSITMQTRLTSDLAVDKIQEDYRVSTARSGSLSAWTWLALSPQGDAT